MHNWKRAFLETGRDGLVQGQRRRSSRELELEAEHEGLFFVLALLVLALLEFLRSRILRSIYH